MKKDMVYKKKHYILSIGTSINHNLNNKMDRIVYKKINLLYLIILTNYKI